MGVGASSVQSSECRMQQAQMVGVHATHGSQFLAHILPSFLFLLEGMTDFHVRGSPRSL